jgi:hypothetical protein
VEVLIFWTGSWLDTEVTHKNLLLSNFPLSHFLDHPRLTWRLVPEGGQQCSSLTPCSAVPWQNGRTPVILAYAPLVIWDGFVKLMEALLIFNRWRLLWSPSKETVWILPKFSSARKTNEATHTQKSHGKVNDSLMRLSEGSRADSPVGSKVAWESSEGHLLGFIVAEGW